MALISIIENFHPLNDARLIDRAEQLTPTLYHEWREPVSFFSIDGRGDAGKDKSPVEQLAKKRMGRGESVFLDFGEHMVGYLTLELSVSGSHPDAPAYLKLEFAESLREFSASSKAYDGWLSRSWIQEEYIHVDILPDRVTLPRRYAFRYLKLTVLDTSPKYRLVVERAECQTETSADWKRLLVQKHPDPLLERVQVVSRRTLANCMQEVFEDGPKRDRRLWLGDLRLQALTNYVSFRNNDLVKRCLYLFGGSRFPDGRVSACVFTKPQVEADDTFLFDYALLYPVILEEYLQETGDEEPLNDLYEIAMRQIEYALDQCGENGLVNEQAVKDSFIDWCDELDKRACTQGILIYALEYAAKLARRKLDLPRIERLTRERERLSAAAMIAFWDEDQGCFLSNGQFSTASQVWMVLAGVPAAEQALRAMEATHRRSDGPRMGTPYLHHYYTMALLCAGLKEQAVAHIKEYWGGMLEAGADTFWECWDGEDPDLSPYGGSVVNSYCHSWSCTPAYFIERFLQK